MARDYYLGCAVYVVVMGCSIRYVQFRWDFVRLGGTNITPSEKLEWHSCFPEFRHAFKCARLTVPMDYHRPLNASENNPKVHIALVMLPGVRAETEGFSKSPMLINPGGPGGSGVDFVLGAGRSLQQIVGEDQDIIGFDPRGVGVTMPRVDCFSFPYAAGGSADGEDKDDYARGDYHRILYTAQLSGVGLPNSSSTALRSRDAHAKLMSKLCAEKDSLSGKDSIFRHAQTPSVARDMLSIVDAWDEWTDGLEKDQSKLAPELGYSEEESEEKIRDSRLDTKGKLVYWGFSYGTLLGSTFASMFPDRVGRLVLDGVVDADQYVSSVWFGSQTDMDKAWASFFTYCHTAKSACRFYRDGDKVEDIDHRYQAVMEELRENPLPLVMRDSMMPAILTVSDFRLQIFMSAYAPIWGFPLIATALDILDRKLGEILEFIPTPPSYDLKHVCEHASPQLYYPGDAQKATLCGDKRYPLNHTFSEIEDMFGELAKVSSFADCWMSVLIQCSGYTIPSIDPPMRWDDHPAHRQKPIKTSFPLFYISNSADPVTPLIAGVKMASKFVDAGLVEQNSVGHCSLAARSICTIRKIRAYFREGKVPAAPVPGKGKNLLDGEWEKCEADEEPWHQWSGAERRANDDIEAAELERMTAWGGIQNAFERVDLWGQDRINRFDLGVWSNV
ncbi:alpha beta-hydrolase protein [Rutstroemia sp. NJR-2017a BBW]|nr:alpha beta-hydrolase protein [Rutstroemia sp. NJR-2017a BBW]